LSSLKRLAGQTAIYGLSTILGRMLNYALVPFYTYIFDVPAVYGLNNEFYAYISFLNIVFTYGMETALFNFSSTESNRNGVYTTAMRSVLVSTMFLALPLLVFAEPLAELMRYPGHAGFVWMAVGIVVTDALTAIPFAKLRLEGRPGRFAKLKLLNIGINLIINFFFIGLCKWAWTKDPNSFFGSLYNDEIGIGYAFVANLAANMVVLLLLMPELRRIDAGFDIGLWKRMIRYAMPLLVVGLAGMVNETLDRILLKYMLPLGMGETAVGIYGACYKISILMAIFRQAFQYAAEPFFFSQRNEGNARELYAKVMSIFIIACSLIFLGTTLNLSWIQYFIGPPFRSGLAVVPILLLANLFLGVYFNLSIWYKLTGRTRSGMWITLAGAVITLTLNFIWIPSQGYFGGYMGSAWATLLCYATMMVLSYYTGQKHYPVPYAVVRGLGYIGLALGLYFAGTFIANDSQLITLLLKNALLLPFIAVVWVLEKPRQWFTRKPAQP
jgi:O-antigen/teichoic acid export membrane protein